MKGRTRFIPLLVVLLTLAFGLAGSDRSAEALDKTVRQQVLRASVKLMTPFDADEQAGSLCSGSMLNQEGYILTNFHCVGYLTDGRRDPELDSMGLRPGDLFNTKGTSVVAITDDPRQFPRPTYVAQVMAADSTLDLAVLKIVSYYNSRQKLPASLPVVAFNLADSDTVETLDEVFVIGYPGIAGNSVTATEGKISGFLDEDEDGSFDWFKTDVLVNQGNSGGSALNENGELIGIPTARLQDGQGNVIYLIRPLNIAVPHIEQALQAGGTRPAIANPPVSPRTHPAQPAGNPSFGRLTFGTGFDENRGVTGIATQFGTGIAEVHAGLPYENLRDGISWGYMWQLDGQDVTGQDALRWEHGASGILNLYLTGKTGLPDGIYNLQVYLRGALVQEGGFRVGQQAPGSRRPAKPVLPPDPGVMVSGTVVDYNNRRPIQARSSSSCVPGSLWTTSTATQARGKRTV
jgi:serine protease Do